eukprot:4315187-Amphidinium_carterae.1
MVEVRICDFGSALLANETHTAMSWLYASTGPTEEEETDGYQPPEAPAKTYPRGKPSMFSKWNNHLATLKAFMGQ